MLIKEKNFNLQIGSEGSQFHGWYRVIEDEALTIFYFNYSIKQLSNIDCLFLTDSHIISTCNLPKFTA